MAETWLLQQAGHERFLTREELESLARAGRIAAGDPVFHPHLDRWCYAGDVDELRRAALSSTDRVGAVEHGGAALIVHEETAIATSERGPFNDAAVAGFTLGVLGIVPVFGVACALISLPLSLRGLRRAEQLGGTDRRFALAGVVLALTSLLINGGTTLLALLE